MVGPAEEIHKTEDMTFTEMEGTNELCRGRKREGREPVTTFPETLHEREEGGGILVGKLGAKGDRFGDYVCVECASFSGYN